MTRVNVWAVSLLTALAGQATAVLVVSAAGNPGRRAAAAQTAGDHGYSSAQADRGRSVYEQSCTSCHGASLRGGANEFAAPPLAGPFFLEKWSGRPVGEVFRYAAENMPPDGKLKPEAYMDVTAYILQVWKYPAGASELTADSPIMKRPIERQP